MDTLAHDRTDRTDLSDLSDLSDRAAHAAHLALAATDIAAHHDDPDTRVLAAVTSNYHTGEVTELSQRIAELTGADPLVVALAAAAAGERRWRSGVRLVMASP